MKNNCVAEVDDDTVVRKFIAAVELSEYFPIYDGYEVRMPLSEKKLVPLALYKSVCHISSVPVGLHGHLSICRRQCVWLAVVLHGRPSLTCFPNKFHRFLCPPFDNGAFP